MKRRPCSGNQNRSSVISSGVAINAKTGDSKSARSRSFQDVKKCRSLHRIPRKQQPIRSARKPTDVKFSCWKNDVSGSLESLFDVTKPLKLPEVPRYISLRETSNFSTSSESISFRKIIDKQPKALVESFSSSKFSSENISKLEELERDYLDEDQQDLDIEETRSFDSSTGMEEEIAENENEKETENENENENEVVDDDFQKTPTPSDDENSPELPVIDEEPKKFELPKSRSNSLPSESHLKENESQEIPTEHDVNIEPLTDSEVIHEMEEADKRCIVIAREIDEAKEQINALKHKENLSDDDTRELQEKQQSLIKKMKELDELTRKIQLVVGLSDPSSRTFAKMFEMMPCVESAARKGHEEKTLGEKEKIQCKESLDLSDDDRFELPRMEYPEDRLPRAIVCGFTEDKIPKIVIPDSRPKGGTRCLKNLTGKLSESLIMQEKLVQENAKLEGGRYKLEEALLEKDSTLESLQKKVCGLQAEMRMVVKENTELNRQLEILSHRSTENPTCCSCPVTDNSPRSTIRQQSVYSYGNSTNRNEEFCDCPACASRQAVNTPRKSCDSPRLFGGGSGKPCSSGTPRSEQGPKMCCRGPAAPARGPPAARPCPADLENSMSNYGNSTKQLAQQLDSMESEVRNMQLELANVHRERQQLEQQKKLLKCTGPCAPCSCSVPGHSQPAMVPCVVGGPVPQSIPAALEMNSIPHSKMGLQPETPSCTGICATAAMGASSGPQQQLRELREQYARLQEDYKNKLCEVSCLRADAENMKQETKEAKEEREKAESRLLDAQERLRMMDSDKLRFQGSKEQMMEQEQALQVTKQRYREAQDELEELRTLIQDQAIQLEDYRNKYLQAQEQVEEQRRQLELMEMDNARMNDNVNLEIGRVKNQFKEKLAELAPLPDILKQSQAKLQEVQHMRLMAERNCEDLSRELLTYKDKCAALAGQLNAIKNENSALHDQKGMGSGRCDELEKKNAELKAENERMKTSLTRFEEHEALLHQRFDEKTHEIVQLSATLEQIREDSARQVARTKERCETVKKSMQGQISEMEKQLAQCRATARAAQKDRDEIRHKMQGQINNLMEAFDQAQGRIHSLQGHVNYLKTSYSNVFSPGGQAEPPIGFMSSETPGQTQGYDSCDCNY